MEVIWILENIDATACIDILLVALTIYLALQLIRGTQAVSLLRGTLIVLLVVWLLTNIFPFRAFSWLVRGALISLAVAVPIIFQQEIRRVVDLIGRAGITLVARQGREGSHQRIISEICVAAERLSERQHGGLIVLEREVNLQEYVDTGVPLDAVASANLLTTAFWPRTELHDGAAIVRSDRIAAAACILPLSAARRLPDRGMGLRHRAALGISEVSDAVAVVVSEENGSISLANNGRLIHRLDVNRLHTILNEFFGDARREARFPWLRRLRELIEARSRP